MRILHLTDLHVSPETRLDFQSKWENILNSLDKLQDNWKPAVIALTGDYGFNASHEEFRLAKYYIEKFGECTSL